MTVNFLSVIVLYMPYRVFCSDFTHDCVTYWLSLGYMHLCCCIVVSRSAEIPLRERLGDFLYGGDGAGTPKIEFIGMILCCQCIYIMVFYIKSTEVFSVLTRVHCPEDIAVDCLLRHVDCVHLLEVRWNHNNCTSLLLLALTVKLTQKREVATMFLMMW